MEVAMWVLGTILVILVAMKLGKYLDSRYPDPVKSCVVYRNEGCAHVDGQLCDYDKCRDRIEYELMVLEDQLDIPDTMRYHRFKMKGLMGIGGKDLLDKLVEEINTQNGRNAKLYNHLDYNPFEVRRFINVSNLENHPDHVKVMVVLTINDTELISVYNTYHKSEQKVGEDRVCMSTIRAFFGVGMMARYMHSDIFNQINQLYEKEKPV